MLFAITAILLAIIWFSPNDPFSFGQRRLEVLPPKFLEVFQVYAPILTKPIADQEINPEEPSDHESSSTLSSESCDVLLMEHSFGFSYGKPFVGTRSFPNFITS